MVAILDGSISWRTGVKICASIATATFLLTLGITIYFIIVYPPEGTGLGKLYLGDCEDMKKISFWAHVAINFVSSILLAGSHYTQQVLSAPTREEIDAAHETKSVYRSIWSLLYLEECTDTVWKGLVGYWDT